MEGAGFEPSPVDTGLLTSGSGLATGTSMSVESSGAAGASTTGTVVSPDTSGVGITISCGAVTAGTWVDGPELSVEGTG